MLNPELKTKLIAAAVDLVIYWAPALFVAVAGMFAWAVPKIANALRERSPWASVDEAITLIERFVLALVHSSMDEAERIKTDPALTPGQKAQKLRELAKYVETETMRYAEKTFGDQMIRVLGENPIVFIRGLIERFVREVKARFSHGK